MSDPPGARIEVNNDYVGDAPTTITLTGNKQGVVRQYVIRATPIAGGQYVQTKVLSHYRGGPSDPVPSRIFFDMRLAPPDKAIKVDVDVHSK